MTNNQSPEQVIEDDNDFDNEVEYCEGCGRNINDPNTLKCPMCCNTDFNPGTEECDFCEYYDECLSGEA